MPTNYNDQFLLIDPASPPPAGTVLTVQNFVLTDVDDDDDIETTDGDTVNGSTINQQYPGDTVTINIPGVGNVTYTGITFFLANGQQLFTPTDGQVLQDGTFVSSTFVTTQGPLDVEDLAPPCFTAGTTIATPTGPKPVEALEIDDLVATLDHGPQPIRWIGKRQITSRALAANPKLRPIRIPAGSICAGLPEEDLFVSRQHRILVRSKIAERMFGAEEVLVPVIKLVGTAGITEVDTDQVTYIHFLFDRHEVVFANRAPTESLFTGPIALNAIGADGRYEIKNIFPDIVTNGEHAPARLLIDNHRSRRLAKRHAANGKPLVCLTDGSVANFEVVQKN